MSFALSPFHCIGYCSLTVDTHAQLISKNVASEVADELCESVITTLVGQRLESFTRVTTVVRKALEAALLRILTPKKSTDVLREILDAKAAGRAYSIVFVGVNGVGKSTSLSKVCYYLKSKGVNVMIAACDTFRSGAVEQLNQHAKVLDVPLFEKGMLLNFSWQQQVLIKVSLFFAGYAKDPASVAKEAVKYGTENGFDCVLIDTAGRMQNNEPLMRALAKLVSNNDPDLVLFVGEALVGNDGIDQLSMFDRVRGSPTHAICPSLSYTLVIRLSQTTRTAASRTASTASSSPSSTRSMTKVRLSYPARTTRLACPLT